MNTGDTIQAIEELIGIIPASEKEYMSDLLATNLKAIISQKLLPNIEENGLIPALEVFIETSNLPQLIKEGKTDIVGSIINENSEIGMQSFDNSIINLLKEGKISTEVALNSLKDKSILEN